MNGEQCTHRIRQLCAAFKLPTVGAEAGPRFQQAGHGPALETLLAVLELEAEDRVSSGASAGCAGAPGCPRGRPGTPLSTTDCRSGCSSNWGNWPGENSWLRE